MNHPQEPQPSVNLFEDVFLIVLGKERQTEELHNTSSQDNFEHLTLLCRHSRFYG